MMFEWDDHKNRTNIAKHGVSLAVGSLIFDGFVLTRTDTRNDNGEVREISIGKVGDVAYLTVIHTDRNGTTRIISARPANRDERRRYEQALSS
jgi:uncharacterized DUF497 family protein